MKKTKKEDMSYNSISGNEQHILHKIKGKKLIVFGVRELKQLTGWGAIRVHNTLQTLKRKKHLMRVKRNMYTTPEALTENPYAVATETIQPSYISHWTALAYYGFTEQQPTTIQVVSPKQQKKPEMNIEVTTLKPARFFGYERTNGFVIAEKEKTLVDALYQPEKCGGLKEVAKCLENVWREINQKKFIDYLLRFKDKSLNSRTGYLMETLNLGKAPQRLLKNRSEGYVKLDASRPKTCRYDRRWRIIVNRETT